MDVIHSAADLRARLQREPNNVFVPTMGNLHEGHIDLIRIGKPKANVAMGRRLLRILYAMVRDQRPFARGPATQHTLRANQARLARKQRKEVA